MDYWTLNISDLNGSNAVEKRLQDWDILGCAWQENDIAMDTLNLQLGVKAFSGADPFPYGKRVRLYLRPEQTGHPGQVNLGAGSKWFDGVITNAAIQNDPGTKLRVLPVAGPWYWFKLPYLQSWLDGTKNPTVQVGSSTHVFLFQNPRFGEPGVTAPLISAAEQLQNIVQFYKDLGCPIDLDLSVPWEPTGLYLPIMPQRNINGESAIRVCLEKAAHVAARWDYTAETPAIRFFDPTSSAELVRNPAKSFGPGAYSIVGNNLVRRSDLCVTAVQINYEITNELNGQKFMTKLDPAFGTVDIYPPTAWDASKMRIRDDLLISGGIIETVDLQGSTASDVAGSIVCEALDLANPHWWEQVVPNLTAPSMKSWSFSYPGADYRATVINMDTGEQFATISAFQAQYPYRIIDGNFCEWMKSGGTAGRAVRVRIAMSYTYEKQANGEKGMQVEYVDATCTNLPTGTYHARASVSGGEPIPIGLAEQFYRAMNPERYEGTLSIVEPELTRVCRVGDVVNLTGGETAWETMNAVVQSVSYDVATRMTKITLGLPKYLNIQQRADLCRLFRIRRVWMNPAAQRDPGQASSGQNVTFPSRSTYTALANPLTPEMSVFCVKGNVANMEGSFKMDGPGKLFVAEATNGGGFHLDLATGAMRFYRSGLKVDINPNDLGGSATAKFRAVKVCVYDDAAGTWSQKTMMVLGTDPA